MQPVDARLRDDLAAIAHEAGPLGLPLEAVVARVKRRRRRSAFGAILATAAVVVGLVGAAGSLGGGADSGPTAAAVPSYPRPFVCGEELTLGPDVAATRFGLSMTLGNARKTSEDGGPLLRVTFTADRALRVQGSPPALFELLYLKRGIIVGGGPMLNSPGDMTPQGMDLIGYGFDVSPDHPNGEESGRRDSLCPGLSWPQVWSDAPSYEAVLVQGRVTPMPESGPNHLLLDIPTLGYWPLIVARTALQP